LQHKQFNNVDFDLKSGSREIIFTINTDTVDRDREVVLPKGLVKKNYAGNPVVLLNHDYQTLPIGKTLWIKGDATKLIAKAYISDKTQLANDVFGLLQDGILSAASIGFAPLEQSPPTPKEIKSRPDWADARNIIRKWEILEWSLVTVPANPEALSLAVSKGYSPETVKFLNGGHLPEAKELISPDCWQWETTAPAHETKAEALPMPKYARCWDDVLVKVGQLRTAADILDTYRGKV